MGQGHYSVADLAKMLELCAPDTKLFQRGHHYWAIRGGLRYTKIPKGSGPKGEAMSRVNIEDGRVHSIVRALGISLECAQRHLPLAWR